MSEHLDLLDYRLRVAEIYSKARSSPGRPGWEQWIVDRDELFGRHPQSPIENQQGFNGLPHYEYDPAWRVAGTFRPDPGADIDVAHSDTGATRFTRIGQIDFSIGDQASSLGALWLVGYGGGLFVPFRDHTNGDETYGGAAA